MAPGCSYLPLLRTQRLSLEMETASKVFLDLVLRVVRFYRLRSVRDEGLRLQVGCKVDDLYEGGEGRFAGATRVLKLRRLRVEYVGKVTPL